MRAGKKERLGTIRMLQAAIKQREVDERITLDDAQVMSVIEKMIKPRKESIAQFEQGGATISPPRNRPKSPCCRSTCPRNCPTPNSKP